MNVYHIVNEQKIESPVTAFCGEKLDRMNGDYVWADQETTDLHCRGKHCQACLDSDDYALYHLANAGESAALDTAFVGGTVTGRISARKPHVESMARSMTDTARRILNEPVLPPQTMMLSPIDYSALEKRFNKRFKK
jgi:hypothetical protein